MAPVIYDLGPILLLAISPIDEHDREQTSYRHHFGFAASWSGSLGTFSPLPIDEAVDMVGLTPRRDHFPAQLSGGEQQRGMPPCPATITVSG